MASTSPTEITFDKSIHGYLVGQIWMPATECWKDLTYNVTRENARFSDGPGTFRDHMLCATNDGDFQHCRVAHGTLRVVAKVKRGAHTYIRTRYFPLAMFPSIADMRRDDWDGPYSDSDDSDV